MKSWLPSQPSCSWLPFSTPLLAVAICTSSLERLALPWFIAIEGAIRSCSTLPDGLFSCCRMTAIINRAHHQLCWQRVASTIKCASSYNSAQLSSHGDAWAMPWYRVSETLSYACVSSASLDRSFWAICLVYLLRFYAFPAECIHRAQRR